MKLILSSLLITFCTVIWAQGNIETEIKVDNVFELSIIDIYPEDYPNVSVVFQAKNKAGKPLWLLKKEEINITENNDTCKIVRLLNVSTNKPLNIALVFDHSGSMFYNPNIENDEMEIISNLYFSGLEIPSDYVMVLDYAKDGVLDFINKTENTSDSILFVGFSETVDKVFPLSNNMNDVRSFLKDVNPSGGTAFYDALFQSIDSLSVHSSSSAIVALTDGQDNSSIHDFKSVIKKANLHNIPIYIIGLGDVDKRKLKRICKSTNGFFYQTNDPEKLGEIYSNIKEQLKSIYQVDYTSLSDDFTSDNRTLKFSFLNDTLSFSNSSSKFALPEEALIYIKKLEGERLAKIESDKTEAYNRKLLLGGLGGGIVLLGIGSFLIIRRKKVKIELQQIYPNPFGQKVTIKYEVSESISKPVLTIVDLRGNNVASHILINDDREIEIETSNFRRGVYLFNISGGGRRSITLKGVKQ